MELGKYAKAVETNYQQLAEICLRPGSESQKVDSLLSLQFKPVPAVKRGYIVWSEGILAEAFACFSTNAFPRLLQALRTSPEDEGLSFIYKALTMWGDRFALALSDWLHGADSQLQERAIHGLTRYAKLLNVLLDSQDSTIEKQLHRENYPELARFMRDEDIGAAPISVLSGTPCQKLLAQLTDRLEPESEQIAHLRCLWQLHDSRSNTASWLPLAMDKIIAIAKNADSRTLEREAVIALCHLDSEGGCQYIRRHWFQDRQRRSMAAEMLGLIRTETAFVMLCELVTDASPETRRKAISSIESFESVEAFELLDSLRERDKKTHRQLLRSRSQLKRRIQRRQSPSKRKRQDAVYFISPLAVLLQIPAQPLFSEQELNASIEPGMIADVSSSRRYAVELGLLERRGDIYRLPRMGTVVHWVETFLQEGLERFAESTSE